MAVIGTSDRSRLGRERIAFVSSECLAGFVKTDDWTGFVVRFVVKVKNILDIVDELSILFGWYPIAGKMRFQGFFRRYRTVS